MSDPEVADIEWSVATEWEYSGATLGLHKVQGSEGPTVVLVHGIEGLYDEWAAVAAHLAKDYSVYSLDMPWRAGGAYVSDGSKAATSFLQAGMGLVEGPLHAVIGHSFGANTLLRYLVETTGTATPQPRLACAVGPFYLPDTVDVTWRDFDRAHRVFSEIIAQGIRVRLGERDARIDDELRALMLKKVLDRIGPFGFHTFFRQYLDSAELDLSVVKTPTLIVGGYDEELFTQDRADAMAKAMPSATVVFRNHLSHFCHIEQPDLVLPDIDELLTTQLAEL